MSYLNLQWRVRKKPCFFFNSPLFEHVIEMRWHVELITNSELPHLATDTGWEAFPPEIAALFGVLFRLPVWQHLLSPEGGRRGHLRLLFESLVVLPLPVLFALLLTTPEKKRCHWYEGFAWYTSFVEVKVVRSLSTSIQSTADTLLHLNFILPGSLSSLNIK